MHRKCEGIGVWLLIAFAGMTLVGFISGFAAAKRLTPPHIAVTAPYYPDCDALWTTKVGPDRVARKISAAERRNIVWNALNGDAAARARTDDGTALVTAKSLYWTLGPTASSQARHEGMEYYFHKSAELMSPEGVRKTEEAFANGDQAGILAGLRGLNRYDREAAAFMACILRDSDRLDVFIQGETIPLEDVP